jgi:hypothetical protein
VNANVIGKAGNFNICFREASMSSHSGLLLFHEFVKSLSVAELIDENLKVKRKERGYATYNGKRGYIPVFAFWSEESELLFNHLLAGNKRAYKEAVWFLSETLKQIAVGIKRKLRADSEFYTWGFIEFCEREEITYARKRGQE